MIYLPWVHDLRTALEDEFQHGPWIASMATVDEHGHPHVRSVVCRSIDFPGELSFVSDARSAKSSHLRRNSRAEVCFWLPQRREQYRVGGGISIQSEQVPGALRSRMWKSLSPVTRATFMWPAPGAERVQEHEFSMQAPDDPPGSFELLTLQADALDWLDLKPTPHRRVKWTCQGAWERHEVNP